MFLLIPAHLDIVKKIRRTLHSTMFLLIRHYAWRLQCRQLSLHSTMFLLIRKSLQHPVCTTEDFTFHYVSINTWLFIDAINKLFPLHSTMFLLIRFVIIQVNCLWTIFTFHYVSINTLRLHSSRGAFILFTFHYVSINTAGQNPWGAGGAALHSTMFLLIRWKCRC